jgi:hypothetical protein
METFIEHRNIARYTEQLKIENDPLKRKLLLELIAEEEAKGAKHVPAEAK